MIKRWIVTGDTHGNVRARLKNIQSNLNIDNPEEYGIIILGDAGINYTLDEGEAAWKKRINAMGFKIYCVRGNHEERPENISTMEKWFDNDAHWFVWREAKYPNIRYLWDGHLYHFGDYSAVVIGGAYSVDKHWRLERGAKWFKDEQLTAKEMATITHNLEYTQCNFVLSHTCPISWQPRDLFLSSVDQSKVDNTMETWLEEIKNKFSWHIWLFGHYHDDRLVRPRVEMFFNDYEFLDEVAKRWDSAEELPWWMKKDPNYYMED